MDPVAVGVAPAGHGNSAGTNTFDRSANVGINVNGFNRSVRVGSVGALNDIAAGKRPNLWTARKDGASVGFEGKSARGGPLLRTQTGFEVGNCCNNRGNGDDGDIEKETDEGGDDQSDSGRHSRN